MSCPKTLLTAVTAGRTRQVRLLLDLGASMEEHDDCGQTPLIRAVFVEHDRNRDKILRMLLKKGAVVSKADVVGRNALAWACLYGRDNEVALMLEYADVDLDYNTVDINGQTGLFHAVSSGNAATVKLMVQALVKYDMSVDIPDSNGVTPLMHSTRLGHDVCASILIYNGNAKVGLGLVRHGQFARKEKWAISSLRERAKVKKCKNQQRQSQFPPITNNAVVGNTPPSSRSRRLRIRHRINTSESDKDSGSSSDEDFTNILSKNLLKNKSQSNFQRANETRVPANTPVMKSLQNVPPCGIPPSILASPIYSNTEHISSGDESEVDSVASTIVEGKQIGQPVADLSSIYGYKQEQMSSSFRQPAVKLEPKDCVKEPMDLLDSTSTSDKGLTSPSKTKVRCEASKWVHLKKGLRLVGVAKANQSKSDKCVQQVDQSASDQVHKDQSGPESRQLASLPKITTEKTLQMASKKALKKIETVININYSEI